MKLSTSLEIGAAPVVQIRTLPPIMFWTFLKIKGLKISKTKVMSTGRVLAACRKAGCSSG